MRKELRPVHDLIECDLCHRTILKGERVETFVGSGDRQRVCELCNLRALRAGWLREAELELGSPERERFGPRRSLWSRARTWAEDQGLWGVPPAEDAETTPAPPRRERVEVTRRFVSAQPTADVEADEAQPAAERVDPEPAPAPREPAVEQRREPAESRRDRAVARADEPDTDEPIESEDETAASPTAWARRPARAQGGSGLRDLIGGGARRREPRRVHAVPTGRYAKIERAFELFNVSEHRRTIAGVGRALGEPWVAAAPVDDSATAQEVDLVVAWELSWYRFRVELDDSEVPVVLLDRGNELDDLGGEPRNWNASADSDGRLELVFEAVS